MEFDWDERKRLENLRKHHLDFVDAVQVFDGPNKTFIDARHEYDEVRYITIGFVRDVVVLVAYTETDDTIRIIHARKANRKTTADFLAFLDGLQD